MMSTSILTYIMELYMMNCGACTSHCIWSINFDIYYSITERCERIVDCAVVAGRWRLATPREHQLCAGKHTQCSAFKQLSEQ